MAHRRAGLSGMWNTAESDLWKNGTPRNQTCRRTVHRGIRPVEVQYTWNQTCRRTVHRGIRPVEERYTVESEV